MILIFPSKNCCYSVVECYLYLFLIFFKYILAPPRGSDIDRYYFMFSYITTGAGLSTNFAKSFSSDNVLVMHYLYLLLNLITTINHVQGNL